jgi:hypothetical protein
MIFEGIFSKKAFEAESVDLSNEEARCIATHITYESILTKSIQNESVGFLLRVVFLADDEFGWLVFL